MLTHLEPQSRKNARSRKHCKTRDCAGVGGRGGTPLSPSEGRDAYGKDTASGPLAGFKGLRPTAGQGPKQRGGGRLLLLLLLLWLWLLLLLLWLLCGVGLRLLWLLRLCCCGACCVLLLLLLLLLLLRLLFLLLLLLLVVVVVLLLSLLLWWLLL